LRDRAGAEILLRKINVAKALNLMSGAEPKVAMRAAQREEYRTRLVLAANQICQAGQSLTAKSIANHFGISRASLYRCFPAEDIRASIRVAREPATKANFEDDY
jgi:AcrR family transcriptional regulator